MMKEVINRYFHMNKQKQEKRAGAENLSENLLPFKVREDIRMDQKNEKKSKKKSFTCI